MLMQLTKDRWIKELNKTCLWELLQVILCSGIIALCAQIRIPLPFTPVPITMQTFAVMMIGGMLGSRNGALCVLMYLAEASFGLPVLRGGLSDPLALIGPTAGYLLGFIPMAYIAGWAFERKRAIFTIFCALLCGEALNMGLGALWLGQFVGISHALTMGVIPFIPGSILKIMGLLTIFKKKSDSR